MSGPDGALEHGEARDISLGGMFIETAASLPFGARVVVSLEARTSTAPLQFSAIVRWVHNTGIGVQFMNLGARETHHLVELTRPVDEEP